MMMKMKYFTLTELIQSNTARILGICNKPSEKDIRHLVELVDNFLDPLRIAWGKPIIVTSGFRCKKLNTAVGGSKTSVHQIGYAADIVPKRGDFDKFVEFVLKWVEENDVPFDQILIESNSKGSRWLHIGLRNNKGEQRRQIKTLVA